MKKRIIAAVLCSAVLFGVCGCKSILDEEVQSVTAHQDQVTPVTDSVIEASTYDELKAAMLGFVTEHEEDGLIHVIGYAGDVRQDVDRACSEIINNDPIGSYAVLEMTGQATKIVSYYEVAVSIIYNKVTKAQLESINNIPFASVRSLKLDLQNTLTDYEPSSVILIKDIELTKEDALDYVTEIYYENPMDIVMLPITDVEFFPNEGPDRIVDFAFVYRYPTGILNVMEKNLNDSVQNIAETVSGDDGDILLSLCQHLMDTVEYDTATAESGDYSTQNTAATAYGALINCSAIGEGYAMAFKALCDELGIECDVVLGALNGKPHVWNIVALEGDYYHIDVSMSDVNGISTAFLKNDTKMLETYTWNKLKYKICNGPLTYETLVKRASVSTVASAGPSTSTT